jgi:hypothetical protein
LLPPPPAPTVKKTSVTPARPSHAVPIRAPALLNVVPPTPAQDATGTVAAADSPSLLPPVLIGQTEQPRSESTSTADTNECVSSEVCDLSISDDGELGNHSRMPNGSASRASQSHCGSGAGSSSSLASDAYLSDGQSAAQTQLLTPGSRPASGAYFGDFLHASEVLIKEGIEGSEATPTERPRGRDTTTTLRTSSAGHQARMPMPVAPAPPAGSTTPTILGYDNGNVTVIGGGVRLGAPSRPPSAAAHRTRSPSISVASRALNTAIGPTSAGGGRSKRTRRRINPTYLGSHTQPGMNGPVMNAQQPGQPGSVFWPAPPAFQSMRMPPGLSVGLGMGFPTSPTPSAGPLGSGLGLGVGGAGAPAFQPRSVTD